MILIHLHKRKVFFDYHFLKLLDIFDLKFCYKNHKLLHELMGDQRHLEI